MPGGGGPGETAQTQIRHGNTDPSITIDQNTLLIFPGSTGAVIKRTTSHWSL